MPTKEHVVSPADDDPLRKIQLAQGTKTAPTEALGDLLLHSNRDRTTSQPTEPLVTVAIRGFENTSE